MHLFLSKQLTDFILARHLSTRSPRSSMFLLICCLLLVKLLQFSNPVKPAQQRTYFCFLYHTFQTTAAQVLAQQYLSEPTEFTREHHLTTEFMLCKYREDTNCEAQASPRAGVCQRDVRKPQQPLLLQQFKITPMHSFAPLTAHSEKNGIPLGGCSAEMYHKELVSGQPDIKLVR